MMSNDKAALPQYGINHAGVVYEAPVEGSMNRYMALIEDYDDLDRIGSVRSCRPYYTFFAREFEAVYEMCIRDSLLLCILIIHFFLNFNHS